MTAQPSYIYIAGTAEGPVKIGFTSSPRSRINAIRNASPVPVGLLHCYMLNERPEGIEKTMHFVLRDKHLNGEWFGITAGEALDALHKTAELTGVVLTDDAPSSLNGATQRKVVDKNVVAIRPTGRRGPKPSGNAKQLLTLRVDQDLIRRFKATGDGWQTRMVDVLRAHAPD